MEDKGGKKEGGKSVDKETTDRVEPMPMHTPIALGVIAPTVKHSHDVRSPSPRFRPLVIHAFVAGIRRAAPRPEGDRLRGGRDLPRLAETNQNDFAIDIMFLISRCAASPSQVATPRAAARNTLAAQPRRAHLRPGAQSCRTSTEVNEAAHHRC